MKRQIETKQNTVRKDLGEGGFSLLAALVFVFFVAFVAAAGMNLMRIRWAILGFVIAVVLALIIASLPDIKRYVKISSM
ncbi:MAG: DUF6893 family small protein [Pyrinomonadaceae bacterium]